MRVPNAQGIRARPRPHDNPLFVRQHLVHIDVDAYRLPNSGIAPTSQSGNVAENSRLSANRTSL